MIEELTDWLIQHSLTILITIILYIVGKIWWRNT